MKTPLIEAKLRPPVGNHLIYRERLIHDLHHNAEKKLLLMVSYAGSGKTTLAAQFLQALNLNYVWYNLDRYDQDPAVFLHYLVTALREPCKDFCKDFEAQEFSATRQWPRLVQELQKINSGSHFIVLDSYESILGAKFINQLLTYLIQHLPSNFHLVILTSQVPRFPLTSCRLSEDLYQLKPTDLAFTPPEAGRLLKENFELSLPESTVTNLVKETEGWPLALVLFAQSLRARKSSAPNGLLESIKKYKDDLHGYFMEEILRSQPRRIQDLLIYAAFLPSFTPSDLRSLLGDTDAELLLSRIFSPNIPIVPLDGASGSFRYHRLFRDFLLEKSHGGSARAETGKRHRRLAAFLEEKHPVEAMAYYFRAGHSKEAVELLERLGWTLLREGRFETLRLLLNRIRPQTRSHNPILLYYAGRIREIQGDCEEAKDLYQRALQGFGSRSDHITAACRGRLGVLEFKRDRFKQAHELFSDNLQELEREGLHQDVISRLIATHANLAKVHCKLEEYERASSHLKETRTLVDLHGERGDEIPLLQAQSLQAVLEGRFQDVLHLGARAKDLCQALQFEAVIPVFDHYCAFAHLYRGDFREASDLAEKGLSFLERQGAEDCLLGALLSDLGHCQMATGQEHQGIKSLSESSRLFKKSHNFCGQFWNDFSLCLLAARKGELSTAWDYWRMMQRNCRQLSLPVQQGMTLTVDAYLSALEQSPDKTMETLAQALPAFMQSHQKMSVFHGLVLAAKAYLAIGRRDLAEETFMKAGTLGDLNQYYYCFHYESEWFYPFVDRLVQKKPQLRAFWIGFPQTRQKKTPSESSDSMRAVSVEPAAQGAYLDLHVHALGPFRILANGWNVPLDRCPSKKALTLLKYLFFKRHDKGVFLDEALEFLWPEMDPQTTRSNLRVILSMLRKVFKRPETGGNGFPNLIRDGNRLNLELGKGGWTDVDEFLNQITLADYKEKMSLWGEALGHYENVVDLYKGDFLCEELYSDWCYMEREYLRDQFLASLTRKSECHEKLGNYTDAITTLYHILRIDRYREDAYRQLIRLCNTAGRKGEIIRVYDMCKKAIEEDLNLELSADTTELYAKISGTRNGASDHQDPASDPCAKAL
jgi:ATP/maltotriose-dependent transcriptional regulator MalT/DNA-binding SARP family transcriptional activator